MAVIERYELDVKYSSEDKELLKRLLEHFVTYTSKDPSAHFSAVMTKLPPGRR